MLFTLTPSGERNRANAKHEGSWYFHKLTRVLPTGDRKKTTHTHIVESQSLRHCILCVCWWWDKLQWETKILRFVWIRKRAGVRTRASLSTLSNDCWAKATPGDKGLIHNEGKDGKIINRGTLKLCLLLLVADVFANYRSAIIKDLAFSIEQRWEKKMELEQITVLTLAQKSKMFAVNSKWLSIFS